MSEHIESYSYTKPRYPVHESQQKYYEKFMAKVKDPNKYIFDMLERFMSLESFGMCSAYASIILCNEDSAIRDSNALESHELNKYIAKAIFLTMADHYNGIDHYIMERIIENYSIIFKTNINRDYLFIFIQSDSMTYVGVPATKFSACKCRFDFKEITRFDGSYKIDIGSRSTVRLVKDIIVPFNGRDSIKELIKSVDKIEGVEDTLE